VGAASAEKVAALVNEIGYLGLGSNIGDRRLNLQACVEMLWTHDVVVLLSSSVYETEPVGEVLEQRPFYNACLRVETRLGPLGLLDACKAVERAFGRVQPGDDGYVHHGPRAVDVDVLLLGESTFDSERLTLPHREVTTRRFVLVPLLELDPLLELPGRGLLSDALERIDGQDVRRAGPPLDVGP
jgi:2-amino-4-hydroxy-6-hydroxymethyldihydropteridine diphosphokinase